VLAHRPDDDRGWATLGLCQTLLGNYQFAVHAYHRALSSAPKNPWYAHNLGHLLDIALGRAAEAVVWLKLAHEGAAESDEVAASYAHALARAGRIADARKVLVRATKRGSSREHLALLKWLDQGAPPDKEHPLPRPTALHARGSQGPVESAGPPPSAKGDRSDVAGVDRALRPVPRGAAAAELEEVLTRGLASLPLDAKQRARARALARDAGARFAQPSRPAASRGGATLSALAAGVAYAIVYVDHVPLTQAEVAACFRVSVASLRARFGELRTHLDLLPGDARYATFRQR
jgi:tetratricopeptide (TPR) repeat protein